jgi:flagellar basal body P-ring formation protein FlgA
MIRIATALVLLLVLGHEAVSGPESKMLETSMLDPRTFESRPLESGSIEPGTLEPKTIALKTPRLKELVTVTSEVVRIGDLVENAGTSRGVPVFRAPDLGQTGAVLVQRITDALRPYDLTDIDTEGLSEVVVTRLSRAITSKDIAARIARAVSGQLGYGDPQNISVMIDRDIRVMHVEATVTSDLMVSRMNVEPRNGRFDISFELPGSAAARRLPLRFTGTAREMIEVATLTRGLRQGEVIKGSDVTIERRAKAEAGIEGVSPEQAIGLAAKAPMRAGQAVRQSDLTKPLVVLRNEPVTITYEVPGIVLTVRGKAAESGAAGDMVSVLNIQTNRTVQATVTGLGRVTVGSSAPIVAAVASADFADPAARNTQ